MIDTLLDNRDSSLSVRRILVSKTPARQIYCVDSIDTANNDLHDDYNLHDALKQADASSSINTADTGSGAGCSGTAAPAMVVLAAATATAAEAAAAAAAAAAEPHGSDTAAGSSGSSATSPDLAAAAASGASSSGSAPKRRKIAPKAPAKSSTAAGKRKATAATAAAGAATSSKATDGDAAAAGGSSGSTAAAAELVQPTGMIPTAAAVFASTAVGDRYSNGKLRTKRERDAPDYQPPMQSVSERRGQLYLSIVNQHRVISTVDASANMAEEEAKTM
jgi:hypothetical protein